MPITNKCQPSKKLPWACWFYRRFVKDLSPFLGDEVIELRTTPFQEREDDADIPPIHTTQQMNQEQDTSSNLNQGPLIRSCAKKLQQQVTSVLAEFDNNITENIILPKSSTLVIIRFKHQGYEDIQEVKEAYYRDHTKEIVLTRSGHKIVPPSSQLD
jgi:hypothetical protein